MHLVCCEKFCECIVIGHARCPKKSSLIPITHTFICNVWYFVKEPTICTHNWHRIYNSNMVQLTINLNVNNSLDRRRLTMIHSEGFPGGLRSFIDRISTSNYLSTFLWPKISTDGEYTHTHTHTHTFWAEGDLRRRIRSGFRDSWRKVTPDVMQSPTAQSVA